jgi:hypothetical protein
VTEFPGFIGRRLVQRLLNEDSGRPVTALVEKRALGAARASAADLDTDRLEVLVGDITGRRLGLGDADYERLRADTAVVFHLAAVYDLAVPAESLSGSTWRGLATSSSFARPVSAWSGSCTSAPPMSLASAPALSTSTSWPWVRASRITMNPPSFRQSFGGAAGWTAFPPPSCARRSWLGTPADARRRSSTALLPAAQHLSVRALAASHHAARASRRAVQRRPRGLHRRGDRRHCRRARRSRGKPAPRRPRAANYRRTSRPTGFGPAHGTRPHRPETCATRIAEYEAKQSAV